MDHTKYTCSTAGSNPQHFDLRAMQHQDISCRDKNYPTLFFALSVIICDQIHYNFITYPNILYCG